MFLKIGVTKQENTCVGGSFLIKRHSALLKKTSKRVFSCEIYKFLSGHLFSSQNTSGGCFCLSRFIFSTGLLMISQRKKVALWKLLNVSRKIFGTVLKCLYKVNNKNANNVHGCYSSILLTLINFIRVCMSLREPCFGFR